jgi:hypothetical protein
MTYHLTPMSKQQHPASSYEGLHLGTSRISLSQRFAARFDGGTAGAVVLRYTGTHHLSQAITDTGGSGWS